MSAKQSKPPPLDKTLRAKVAEVIRQLPVRPELDSAEPIQRAARLITFAFDFAATGSNSRRMARARNDLVKLTNVAQRLAEAIKSMPPELLEAIVPSLTKRGLAAPNRLLDAVDRDRVLHLDVETLRDVLRDTGEHFAPRQGRPESQPAAAVSEMAASVFTELTGNAATPGYNAYTEERSVFEQFLAQIFGVLGIEANTERRTKSLRDKMKKK